MNEFENTFTDVQEPVVEVQETNALENDAQGVVVEPQEPSGAETEPQGEGDSTDIPTETVEQSRLENSLAKAARLKAERETAERIKMEQDAQIAAAGMVNPYTGEPIKSHEEFLAYAEAVRKEELQQRAEQMGVDPAVLEAEYQEKLRTQKENDDLKAEVGFYKQQFWQWTLEKELAALKDKYPELNGIKHVSQLGEDFMLMRVSGVSLDAAYKACKMVQEENTKPVPPSMGAVGGNEEREKDFYTKQEVDKLTPADFKRDPKLLEKVQKSMTLWQ